jgi:hypothetical protein
MVNDLIDSRMRLGLKHFQDGDARRSYPQPSTPQ